MYEREYRNLLRKCVQFCTNQTEKPEESGNILAKYVNKISLRMINKINKHRK
jgi:hypothetical protein